MTSSLPLLNIIAFCHLVRIYWNWSEFRCCCSISLTKWTRVLLCSSYCCCFDLSFVPVDRMNHTPEEVERRGMRSGVRVCVISFFLFALNLFSSIHFFMLLPFFLSRTDLNGFVWCFCLHAYLCPLMCRSLFFALKQATFTLNFKYRNDIQITVATIK